MNTVSITKAMNILSELIQMTINNREETVIVSDAGASSLNRST